MAYPGRPPLVTGIPMPPAMGLTSYMPPILPSVMHMPPMMPVRPFRQSSSSKYLSAPPKKATPESGPAITVFIGNIAEHAPDLMIKHILSSCGQVLNWKRIQGFGFCEFGSPESALRAVRLLHEMTIGPKKLVVKVDANTTVILDDYKKAQRRKQGQSETSGDLDDYVDDNMRRVDRQTQDKIYQIIDDFDEEMKNALLEKEEENKLKKEIIQNLPDKNRAQKSQEILTKLTREAAENSKIQEDFEEGKRDIITREIGKFREIMKKQEAEREEERLRREEMQGKLKEKGDKPRSPSRSRSISAVRSPRSPRSPQPHSKASTPEPRHRNKNRRGNRSHSRSRERERDRDRDREREREPRERQSKREVDRALAREREEEEEAKERKKLEKKTREKEVAYQERVRAWESRERRKRKDYEKDKEKKRIKEEETEREAKRLKEFLEDYDDERDDIKYYKGRELQRRIFDREKERESDDKDRAREKAEIDELRNKVLESEHSDPTAVYEQLLQEHEEMYKPKIIIDVNAEQMSRLKEREERERVREREREEIRVLEEQRRNKEEELAKMRAQEAADTRSPSDDDSDRGGGDLDMPGSAHSSPSPDRGERDRSGRSSSPVAAKKKKLDVKDVFNADEDEDSLPGAKKRKLVPLDYGEEKEKGHHKEKEHKKSHHKRDKDKDKDDKKGDENSKSTEEKRKNIKSLIDKIPTDKSALFDFTIDWSAVDNQLMERRIRPWINKKIIEYIGEPEPTLVDFICSKVLAGSQPQGILDDVQMVLDEEAEVFVVKMWRLLIYEIEAKKLGLVK